MKVKEDLMLREVMNEWMIIPMGERLLEFNGISKLNESGVLLWKILEKGAEKNELVSALLETYEVDAIQAEGEVNKFLEALRENKMLEE
nr:PqqD family protein [uncultured Cellulosilyticum sp.]